MPRSYRHQRDIVQRVNAIRTRPKATGFVMKVGATTQSSDDVRGTIRSRMGGHNRPKPTLSKMPWDGQPQED